MNLTTATPAEIDTVLAAIYETIYDAETKARRVQSDINSMTLRMEREAKGGRPSYTTQDDVDRAKARLDVLLEEIRDLYRSCAPYNEEFDRRGGWTRAWLVDNKGGHVHNTMECSTCFERTRFGWLPQVSGLTEEEIVAQAGESACTVCYPSAPAEVLNNPSALELPKRREERLAREAENAARRAKKAEKSLSLDGSVVEVKWDRPGERYQGWKELKTYRAAELFVVGGLSGTDYDKPTTEVIEQVIEMMAAKKGKTVEEIREPLAAKAAIKAAKGY